MIGRVCWEWQIKRTLSALFRNVRYPPVGPSTHTPIRYNRSAFFLKGGKQYANVAESIDSRGAGNAAAKAGTLGSTVEHILADLKPEAAYFFVDDSGQRSGSIVFDMKDPSEIPAVVEPWFIAFNATVSLRPIMNPQDLGKAGPSIGKAAKQYGK
jgi:hypothetical protein